MSGLYARIDVAMARDPRMIAAGPLARLLYIHCVLYSRENLTDGRIHRAVLPLVSIDIRSPSRHMDRLVEVGSLVEVEDGWQIPLEVWTRYNPMKSEVDEKRQAEADRKASYRDRQRRAEMSQRDTHDTHGTRDRQPEPEPEPEPEPSSSSHYGSNNELPPPVENEEPEDIRIRIALNAIIAQRINGSPKGDKPAYRRAVEADVRSDHLTELKRIAWEWPDAPPDVLAASAQGDNHSLAHYTHRAEA